MKIDCQQKHFDSQKYLFSQNVACLVTNAALGAHWSCVKRCAEDGKCQKYLFFAKFCLFGD